MMNADYKRKWIDALRSGKYRQAQGQLMVDGADGRSFCCLGVLCDIVDPDGWYIPAMGGLPMYRGENAEDGDADDQSSAFLPESVSRIAELPFESQHDLSALNDTSCLNFEAIADYIEEIL